MNSKSYMGTAETYENVFRSKEPIPNSNDRYKMILEENARAQMALFSPTHNNSAQRIGRLYEAGMNHPLIDVGLERAALLEQSGPQCSPIPKTPPIVPMTTNTQSNREGEIKKAKGGRHANTISVQHSMTSKHQYTNNPHSPHIFNPYPSHDSGGGAVAGTGLVTGTGTGAASVVVPLMKTAAALGMIDKQAGGKYHVPEHLHEPYSKPLIVSRLFIVNFLILL